MHERQMFIMRARERQRPTLADQAPIGPRLLDGNSALVPLYDEHEVRCRRPHLADRPIRWRSPKPGATAGSSAR